MTDQATGQQASTDIVVVEEAEHLYRKRNLATRIDVFGELTPTAEPALRELFRKLDAAHFVDEVVIPTLRVGEAQVFCTVRDRPWPPWGLGARTLSGYCEVHEIAPDSYAASPVYLAPEDATNIGLAAALYREALQALAMSDAAEICYLVREGSALIDHVLQERGFARYDDVFLTEEARYFTYRAPVEKVMAALHLDRVSTPDLLNGDFPKATLETNALFHQSIAAAADLRATLRRLPTEIIHLPRGGHASKPGGVPGGTGTDRIDILPEHELPYAVIGNFLSDARDRLLEEATRREADFRAATVHPEGADGPQVDERVRRARTLDDIGGIRDRFLEQLKGALPGALQRLGLDAFPVGEIEMQITASSDGDFFRMHQDSDASSTRMLSFVYFFNREPRGFSGGELRIFDDRGVSPRAHADGSFLLSPRQDTIVFFPAHRPHELLPVRVPAKQFADSRFTINGWVHRARN